jgi:phosphoesterase RecJ-like protein
MDEAVQAVWDAKTVVLAAHVNPDGDTLGSVLALGLGLEALGKRVTLLSSDGVPATYAFLPEIGRIGVTTDRRDFDLAIGLDAGELSRTGVNADVLASAPVLMDIDHHVTAGPFGQIRLIDGTAAATGEIVYDLLLALGIELTLPIAQALLCALLTDTGSFRFMNVTPRTMAIAGALIGLGASPNQIAEEVFENKPFAGQKLLGRALESLARTEDGRVVWAHVTQKDFGDFAAEDNVTDGIVNVVRSVRGAEIAVFLREMPDGRLRVSLRARPGQDVASVAARFGGGGHRLAAGCTLDGPLEAAEARLVAAVVASLAPSAP